MGDHKPRRRAPVPAALAMTHHIGLQDGKVVHVEQPLVEQLAPTDPLRLRLVASDPEVREALELVGDAHAKVVAALARATDSPEAAPAHEQAVRVHVSLVRGILEPAILRAEKRQRMLVAATPPDHAALASAVGRRVTADRVLAVDNLLRRNPSWKDPALWTAPDTIRYLAKAVHSEAHFIFLRQREADRPKKSRGDRPFRGPSESVALRQEQMRLHRVQKGLQLLRKLYRTLPADQRRVVMEMAQAKCGPYQAARRLGLARSTAVALRARAERLLAKNQQSRRSSALH